MLLTRVLLALYLAALVFTIKPDASEVLSLLFVVNIGLAGET